MSWQVWEGGAQPVSDDTYVSVVLRNRQMWHLQPAHKVRWHHSEPGSYNYNFDVIKWACGAHENAHAMALYAQDAAYMKEPWRLWEMRYSNGDWGRLSGDPAFVPGKQYRRRATTEVAIDKANLEVLDYLMAEVQNKLPERTICDIRKTWPNYCSDPAATQPILEMERIALLPHASKTGGWEARTATGSSAAVSNSQLVAGIRCLLISKYGPTAQVPTEFVKAQANLQE